jgi:GntR family transcriptional regulator / MocR family aminotransferase
MQIERSCRNPGENGMSTSESPLKKRRRRSIIAFEMIRLDRSAAEPLHEQLYRQIRDELKSGAFADTASRLPSSRALAIDLGISRLTVNLAFSKLHAEGYLRSKARSGTFVANPLPETFFTADKFTTERIRRRGPKAYGLVGGGTRLSNRARAIPDQRAGAQFDLGALGAGAGISLVPGVPAVDEFPIDIWERVRSRVLAQKGAHLLRHASSRGDAELRKAIATYLCDFRGARCYPDQVLIVGGMQQAMLISAMALLDPGEPVWIEDPGFHQARRVFVLAGAKVIPKPVDNEGIVIGRPSKEKRPKIIHVTPSHQYPLGMTTSFDRRTDLLDFVRAHDAFIFEDDFYAEFRFAGPPLPCLQGIDDFGRVIYAGTLSKILYPSLRLGYLVAPEALIDPLVKIRSTMDQHSSAIDQATLARFITEGFFLSHIKRMRRIYAERREVFIRQFNELLGDRFTLQVPEGGLNMVAWLKREEDFPAMSRVTQASGVKPTPLLFYCIRARPRPAFVFGFAGWTPAQIQESLLKLASSLRRAGIP